MARDGIWSKKAKYGKLQILEFIEKNPDCYKNEIANSRPSVYNTIKNLIDENFILVGYEKGLYRLRISAEGKKELERQKRLTKKSFT